MNDEEDEEESKMMFAENSEKERKKEKWDEVAWDCLSIEVKRQKIQKPINIF